MREITRIILHCTDSPHEINGKLVDAATIRKWHTLPPPHGRGWDDIGYHYVIDKNGAVEKGRPDEIKGAHAEGHNHDSLGVVFVGSNLFYVAQFLAGRKLLADLMLKYSVKIENVICHYQVNPGKSCPNMKRDELLQLLFGGAPL